MNKFTIFQSEMDSINFSLNNEGTAFLKIESSQVDGGSSFSTLRACPIVCGRFGPKAQIWRYTIIGDCVAILQGKRWPLAWSDLYYQSFFAAWPNERLYYDQVAVLLHNCFNMTMNDPRSCIRRIACFLIPSDLMNNGHHHTDTGLCSLWETKHHDHDQLFYR